MEFYLIESADVVFSKVRAGTMTRNSKPVNVAIETYVPYPIADDDGEEGDTAIRDHGKYSAFLENSLIEVSARFKSISDEHNISGTLTVSLTIESDASSLSDSVRFQVRIFHGDNDSECCILKRLREVHGEDNVLMTIVIGKLMFHGNDEEDDFNVAGKDLPIKILSNLSNGKKKAMCGCEFEVQYPPYSIDPFKAGVSFSAKLTVTVSLNHEVVNYLYQENFYKSELLTSYKAMLEDQICTDFVIIAGKGVEVKCHKSVLAAKSEVFKAMFRSGMEEPTTNSIHMPDVCEDAIRAFLAYIYYWDLSEASKHCNIAFELLCAGHKYLISEMEIAMRGILFAKPHDWFNVDTAIKLLLFAQNLTPKNGKAKLQMRALGVLTLKSKESYDLLLKSAEFKKLFEKTPEKAMEVSALFLSFFP